MKFENFYDHIQVSGTLALNATLAAVAAVQDGPIHPDWGKVTLETAANHGFSVGDHRYIEGTTNYDGLRKIVAVPAADTFTILAPYVAETPAGTETVKVAVAPGAEFRFVGFSIHMSAAPSSSEDFTIDLDSEDGAAFDLNFYTKDFSVNSDKDILWTIPEDSRVPEKTGSLVRVAWANTDGRTYGIKLWFQRRL